MAPEVDAAVADDDAAGAPAPPADIGAMLVVLTSEDLVQLGVSGPRFDAWHAKKLGSGQAEAAPPPPPPPRSRSPTPAQLDEAPSTEARASLLLRSTRGSSAACAAA